jgi:hypothetical protein
LVLLEHPERSLARGGLEATPNRLLQSRLLRCNPAALLLNKQKASALDRLGTGVAQHVLPKILNRVRALLCA